MPGIRTRVERNGRILIPAALRRQLGLVPGKDVTLEARDGILTVTTPEAALAGLRALASGRVPKGVSLVDDLLAYRRADRKRG